MLILILFAFIAGVVTILSPCILPVLPIILSGSVASGKRRPLGIVTGFIVSFTFFTLFLSTLVRLSGISADALRYVSIVILVLFGLTLTSSRMQGFIETLFSKVANRVPSSSSQKDGFLGGILVGLSLGLLWTPCVGPILASVISLALTGTVTAATFLITFSYALGTAIPMLAITYGGRAMLQKSPWLLSHTAHIQKAFGVVMILIAIAIYLNLDRQFQTYILEKFPQYGVGLTKFEDVSSVQSQLEKLQNKPLDRDMIGKPKGSADGSGTFYRQAPELIAGGEWFNSKPLTLASLKGKVVLIDFWTYTCINCIRTLPYLRDWHEKYKDQGLVIIGVHTPEFEFEKNPDNVKKAIEQFKLSYPIVQDNNYDTWNNYDNRYWPAKYFIDKDGQIRGSHFGEGSYDESEMFIQKLLKEKGADVADMKIKNPDYHIYSRTPELFLGYLRINYLSSPQAVSHDKSINYTAPSQLPQNTFALSGMWKIGGESARGERTGKIIVSFESQDLFSVMRSENGKPVRMRLKLDGKNLTSEGGEDVKDGIVTVTQDRLYKLIHLDTPGRHLLEIELFDSGLEVFSFTFG